MSASNTGQLCPEQTQVEYKIASDCRVREEAFRLVYESYLNSGLVQPNPFKMRILPHHLLPETDMFVAEQEGQVLSTVTLVCDGELGLPMETVYPHEVAVLRRQGKKVGEVSCLASRDTSPVTQCLDLLRLMVQTARCRGLDCLTVAVHPKHTRFYKRFLAFEQIGAEVSYPAVCDQPAIALLLDFDRIDREQPAKYDRFFGDSFPAESLWPQPMDVGQQEYFRYLMEVSSDFTFPLRNRINAGQARDSQEWGLERLVGGWAMHLRTLSSQFGNALPNVFRLRSCSPCDDVSNTALTR